MNEDKKEQEKMCVKVETEPCEQCGLRKTLWIPVEDATKEQLIRVLMLCSTSGLAEWKKQ